MDYNTYIQSGKWKAFRQSVVNRQPYCQACGRRGRMNVHHVTYENLGHEGPEDVLVLCPSCHQYHHATGISLNIRSLPRTAPTIKAQHKVTEKEWTERKESA